MRSTATEESAALNRAPGEPGRGEEPDQLPRPERQQVVGHEPDRDRVPERRPRAAARPILVPQEEAPAHQADGEGERGEDDGERAAAPGARPGYGAATSAEVDAAERPHQQSRRDSDPGQRRDAVGGPARAGRAQAVGKRERDEVEQLLEERPDGGELTALLQGGDQLAPDAAARSSAARPR